MVGFVAFDFVLGLILARVVDVSFVIHVLRMHLDDSPADPPGLRVPAYTIMQLESFFHTSSFEDFAARHRTSPAAYSRSLGRSRQADRRKFRRCPKGQSHWLLGPCCRVPALTLGAGFAIGLRVKKQTNVAHPTELENRDGC